MKPALRLHLAFAGLGVTAAAFPAILPPAVVAHGDAALAARVEGAKNWREAYLAAVRDLTMTTASTPCSRA